MARLIEHERRSRETQTRFRLNEPICEVTEHEQLTVDNALGYATQAAPDATGTDVEHGRGGVRTCALGNVTTAIQK